MADNQLTFQDVQASVNQLVNDNTEQNNAVASQIKEVQRLLTDFAAKSNQGNTPSQAQFQSMISQLSAVHSMVESNTAAIQASATAIAEADPAQSGQSGSSTQEPPVTDFPDTNQTNAGPATTDENTSSGTGLTGSQL